MTCSQFTCLSSIRLNSGKCLLIMRRSYYLYVVKKIIFESCGANLTLKSIWISYILVGILLRSSHLLQCWRDLHRFPVKSKNALVRILTVNVRHTGETLIAHEHLVLYSRKNRKILMTSHHAQLNQIITAQTKANKKNWEQNLKENTSHTYSQI